MPRSRATLVLQSIALRFRGPGEPSLPLSFLEDGVELLLERCANFRCITPLRNHPSDVSPRRIVWS